VTAPLKRVVLRERELHAWASVTERLMAIEVAARAYVRRRTARGLRALQAALRRRPRP
jgi:hypothetical protein